jgi:TolB protein
MAFLVSIGARARLASSLFVLASACSSGGGGGTGGAAGFGASGGVGGSGNAAGAAGSGGSAGVGAAGGTAGAGGTGGTAGAGGTGGVVVGERIAYRKQLASFGALFTARVDGSDELQVTNDDSTDPTWSPDGKRIAFMARPDSATPFGLFVIDADGSNRQTVIAAGAAPIAGTPDWSPDGTRIAFQVNAGGHHDIHTVAPDGTNLVPLIATPDNEGAPSWSPDGTKIAFSRNLALWIANADGSEAHAIVQNLPEMFTIGPDWAPDGSRIVFSVGDFEADLYTVAPDGTGVQKLTSAPGGEYAPSFSPSGQSIAVYHFESTANYGIFRVDPTSGALSVLIPEGESPSYQP